MVQIVRACPTKSEIRVTKKFHIYYSIKHSNLWLGHASIHNYSLCLSIVDIVCMSAILCYFTSDEKYHIKQVHGVQMQSVDP